METVPFIIRDRKIRIAVLGCGRISKNHLNAIAQHQEDFELVGVCDTDSQILAQASAEYKTTGYATLEDLLTKSNADVVSICTPSGLHPRQAIEIAAAGKHVISEKPMATRWHEGLEMVRACEDAGVRLFVVKQNRRNATLQLLKKAIDNKRFGRIYMVSVNVFWTRPQSYYDQGKWRYSKGVR